MTVAKKLARESKPKSNLVIADEYAISSQVGSLAAM
jgi:hypothetical protein